MQVTPRYAAGFLASYSALVKPAPPSGHSVAVVTVEVMDVVVVVVALAAAAVVID